MYFKVMNDPELLMFINFKNILLLNFVTINTFLCSEICLAENFREIYL